MDGSGYIYYQKGSLAGLLLDIMIRDASDNKHSLDTVMRELYTAAYKAGRGFTSDDFTSILHRRETVWAAANRWARSALRRDPQPSRAIG